MPNLGFGALEAEGWNRNAPKYNDVILGWTSQAFDPILNTFGPLTGKSFLDVCTGTGLLADAALRRGAIAEGVDVASNMISIARSSFPKVKFLCGDAEKLPYLNQSFDAVACSFGLLHMEHPELGVAEMFRVLRPGGRFTYSVWHGPEDGGTLMEIMFNTLSELANLDLGLPLTPPMFDYADPRKRDKILHEVGFKNVEGRDPTFIWYANEPKAIEQFIRDGAVRGGMIFDRQTEDIKARIVAALISRASQFAFGSGVAIPCRAHLATAIKPL